MGHDPVELLARSGDARSRAVVLVSHCLLNENTRYLGGAFQPGPVPEVLDDIARQGVGVVQVPCPEQQVWGGVLKRHLLRAYGARGGHAFRLRAPLLAAFLWVTRRRYARLARRVARDVQDYTDSGFRVVGFVGVGGSPSCGVRATMNVRRALDVVAARPAGDLDRDELNRRLLVDCRTAGAGLFTRALCSELERRRLEVPLLEHDLLAEWRGEPQHVLDDVGS